MELFFDRLLQGVQSGAVYASLALALVIVHRTTGLLNFAQGEMATFSLFVTWQLTDWGLPLWAALVVSMALSFVGGAFVERVLVRPVGDFRKNPLAIVIVTIGLLLALNAVAAFIWGSEGLKLPRLFPENRWEFGPVTVSATLVGVLGILGAEALGLWFVFMRTRIGLAMRAVASNPESARLCGIRIGTVLMFGWGLAAATGAVASLVRVITLPSLSFDANIMQFTLVYAFAAAILGGLDSPPGAVVGGLVVGVAESLSAGYVSWIGPDLALVSAFALILVVLIVRPEGLFGEKKVVRV
ncbi:MAG: branched-chain amino acid ABC transporter permease [Acidimicrobiales bacterium]|nr:MAG: branched-chain amino acid ABC transporter permease [Acidimicrobiales bacterium]